MGPFPLAGEGFLLLQDPDKTGGCPDEIEVETELSQFKQPIPGLFQGVLSAPVQEPGQGLLPVGFCGRRRPGVDAQDQGTGLRVRWGHGSGRRRGEKGGGG